MGMNHKQNSIKGIKMKEVNLYLNHYYLNIVSKYLLEISILNLQTNSQKQREYVAKIFLYLDLGQVFRHIFSRIFIDLSSFAWGVVINIKENL